MAKDADYIRMIHSKGWLRLRKQKLTEQPWCEHCLKYSGRRTAATEVHHITPVEDARTMREKELLMYSMANLMSVCRTCHCQIHTELGSRSKKEMAAKRRIADMDAFKARFCDEKK